MYLMSSARFIVISLVQGELGLTALEGECHGAAEQAEPDLCYARLRIEHNHGIGAAGGVDDQQGNVDGGDCIRARAAVGDGQQQRLQYGNCVSTGAGIGEGESDSDVEGVVAAAGVGDDALTQ